VKRLFFTWTILLLTITSLDVGAQQAVGSQEELDPFAGVEEMVVLGSGSAALLDSLNSGSVTAFDSQLLGDLGVQDVSDISSFTPNLEIVTAGTTSPTLFIRGVGLNDFSPIATGAIAVYQDDVPRNAPSILLGRIFDAEAVTVSRGPQGSGPYRNASAGAIKIYPRKPSGEIGGFFNISTGNYDYIDAEGAIDVPIIPEVLAVRTAFGVTKRDGWMLNRCGGMSAIRKPRDPFTPPDAPPHSLCGENVVTNNPSDIPVDLPRHVNREQNWAIRSIFEFTPESDVDMSWLLNIHYSRVDDDSQVGQAIGAGPLQMRSPNDPSGVLVPAGSGGEDLQGYRDADIIETSDKLLTNLLAECGALCSTRGPNRAEAIRVVASDRNRLLGKSLEKLDSDPFAGAFDAIGPTRNENFGSSVNGEIEISDGTILKTITGYEQWDRYFLLDLDFTPNTAFHLQQGDKGFQVSQELRLWGELPTEKVMTWEVGALALFDTIRVDSSNDTSDTLGRRVVRDYDQQTLSLSGYVEGSWEISEVFSLEAGARWNWDRKQIDYKLSTGSQSVLANEDVSWDAPTGTARLNYLPTEDVSFYLKYTRGWKSGSFNATGDIRQGVSFAAPERIDAWEFGGDSSFFEGRVGFSAALFYYDYYNYQIFTSESNLSSLPEFVTINANSAINYGAEAELKLEPWTGMNLVTRFGWLENRFTDFTQRQDALLNIEGSARILVTDIDQTGHRLLNSPRFSVSIIASQAFDLGRLGIVTFRYNGAWKDSVFFDASEGRGVPNPVDETQFLLSDDTIGQKAFWLHGAGIDWAFAESSLVIAVWGRNLTNEGYKTASFDLNRFLDTTLHFVGDPRTYGATLRMEF